MRRLVLIGWMLSAGCGRGSEPVSPEEPASPEAAPAGPKTAPSAGSDEAQAKAAAEVGPLAIAPSSAAPEVRVAAVKRLLAGGPAVGELSEVSTEPGQPFDPMLVDRMTPRAQGMRRVPRVRQGQPKVIGALDKDIVRRIIRAHINEIRFCYNQALDIDLGAEGTVTVSFEIAASGKVGSAAVDESDLGDPDAGECIVSAVERWKFPRPTDEATVEVTQTFRFEPG